MRSQQSMWRRNCQTVRSYWGTLERGLMRQLRTLTNRYGLSVCAGDLSTPAPRLLFKFRPDGRRPLPVTFL
jgi:hypothetical protein